MVVGAWRQTAKKNRRDWPRFQPELQYDTEYDKGKLYAEPLTPGTRWSLKMGNVSDCYGTMACLKCDWTPPEGCDGQCLRCHLDCKCLKGGK